MSNKYRLLLIAGLVGSLALAGSALAQTNKTDGPDREFGRMGLMMGLHQNVIVGTVAIINGNTLTVTRKIRPKDKTSAATSTTYTVDATNAKVIKNGVASTVANIAVGDTVIVTGTVNGTNITATAIRDNVPQKPDKEKIPAIQGNGQPVIAGTVTVISGNTLTVKNNNVTYTVDATNATVSKNGATSTLSGVTVGDNVIVQGTVNGTNITASSIIDHAMPANDTNNEHHGFFGSIGNFFRHLFGF